MTPKLRVAELYRKYRQPRSFTADCYLHARTGHVIDTPRTFLMGRPVMRSAPEAAISDPRIKFRREDCDGWFIWAMAGDLTEVYSLMPFPLPYVGWVRRAERIRWYPVNKAWQVINRVASSRAEPPPHAFV
jgi:hypothetical protein